MTIKPFCNIISNIIKVMNSVNIPSTATQLLGLLSPHVTCENIVNLGYKRDKSTFNASVPSMGHLLHI